MRRVSKVAFSMGVIFGMGLMGFSVSNELAAETVSLAQVAAGLGEDRERAYRAITAGNVFEGAVILAESLRAIPGDDAQFVNDDLVDAGVASTRLAVFIMAELMDDAVRKEFVDTVLDPDRYLTDDLIQVQYDVTHGPSLKETYILIDKLWALANSANAAARLSALCILAAPDLFEQWSLRPKARQYLIDDYPDLAVTRTVLRWSLDACRAKGAAMPNAMAKVLNVELTTPPERDILEDDPAVLLLKKTLPDLVSAENRDQGVAQLTGGIVNHTHWKDRFACLNLAIGYRDIGYAEPVETACATLARSGLNTPDVTRAKCLMLGFGHDAGNVQTVRYWGDELLAMDRILDTVDRTLHEEVRKAIQRYADFLVTRGLREEGAAVYERLAAKYPNSALAAQSYDRAAAIREDRYKAAEDQQVKGDDPN